MRFSSAAPSPAPPPLPNDPAPALDAPPEIAPLASPESLEEPEEEPGGPRAGRGFGVGLGVGFGGLLSVTAAWMSHEIVSVEISAGLIFPTLDARVRVYGFRSELTPVFGAGLTHPFGGDDPYGADIPDYENLYTLGPSIHLDLGVSWAPLREVDLFAGVAFVSTLDGGHPDQVFFFPQFAFQAIWYL